MTALPLDGPSGEALPFFTVGAALALTALPDPRWLPVLVVGLLVFAGAIRAVA